MRSGNGKIAATAAPAVGGGKKNKSTKVNHCISGVVCHRQRGVGQRPPWSPTMEPTKATTEVNGTPTGPARPRKADVFGNKKLSREKKKKATTTSACAFPRGSVCRIAAVTSGFRLANEPDSWLSQPSFTTRCPLTCHNGGRRFFFSSHKIRGGQQPRAASPHAPAKAPRPRSQDRRPPALFTTASPRANKTKARARAYREERWRATRKKKKKAKTQKSQRSENLLFLFIL